MLAPIGSINCTRKFDGLTVDADELSCVDSSNAKGGCGFLLKNGYGNLVATWGADVPVSLNTRTERIDWSASGVSVETPKGTIKGRTALITVSTGILGARDILFVPGLPDWKLEASKMLTNQSSRPLTRRLIEALGDSNQHIMKPKKHNVSLYGFITSLIDT